MMQLLKKGWFQVILAGILIGAALIALDAQFNWFGKHKPRKFNGTVEANTDDIYFTTAEYSSFTWDFGKVKEGDTLSHTFTIKNTGDEPLYIFKVTGNCDCLATFYSSKPIGPGVEDNIIVKFSTRGRSGKQSRTINISTNTDPSEAALVITGEVE